MYSEYEQRQLDIATGEELDRVIKRLEAQGICPYCGNSGRIYWAVAGDKVMRIRPCERCGDK